MAKLRVTLNIPHHRYMMYYRGEADTIFAVAHDGRTVRFPARVLRPFLTQHGIVGTFVIEYGPDRKLVSVTCESGTP